MDFLSASFHSYIKLVLSEFSNIQSKHSELLFAGLPDTLTNWTEHRLSTDLDKRLSKLLSKCSSQSITSSSTDCPFGTVSDVDMRNLSVEHYDRICPSTSSPSAEDDTDQVSLLNYETISSSIGGFFHVTVSVSQADLVQRLLVTFDPNLINHCVDGLLKSGINSEAILRLNSQWIPTLYYLASLETLSGHGPPIENNVRFPNCFLNDFYVYVIESAPSIFIWIK